MRKMLMLATTAAMIEQFNKNNILILEEMGYEIHVAGNWLEGNPISEQRLEEFKGWLDRHHGKWFHITATRKPMDFKNNGKAYCDVVDLITKYKYEFIHCHTPIGSVIGRLAAKRTHTKIIYTAHGFHFFKGAPLKNWILYFPAEWICSWMTDVLITINTEDFECAKRHLHAKKTEYIPGVGIDVEKFAVCYVDKKTKCRELGIPDDKFILLSVGELQEEKNHKIVIDALGKMQNRDIYYLIVGQGGLRKEYEQLIQDYHLEGNIRLLGYRIDIDELCEIADCFVHIAFQEGLSVALLEAMASDLPIIGFSERGVNDLVEHNRGGLCVDPKSVNDVQSAIQRVYQDKSFCNMCGSFNHSSVKKYCVENIDKVMNIEYKNINSWRVKHIDTIIRAAAKRKELGIENEDFVIISVGELNANKNQEVIIQAIAGLDNLHIKYIICGQGELAKYLTIKLKKYNLEKKIYCLGYRSDIKDLLQMADLFAFPSLREGLSMALMEAMASGLPVICGDIRGNRDLIDEGGGGYLVSGNKSNTYAYAISKIMKSGTGKEVMGKYNLMRIRKFSKNRVCKIMNDIYVEQQKRI